MLVSCYLLDSSRCKEKETLKDIFLEIHIEILKKHRSRQLIGTYTHTHIYILHIYIYIYIDRGGIEPCRVDES